jgi:hypothetical protein
MYYRPIIIMYYGDLRATRTPGEAVRWCMYYRDLLLLCIMETYGRLGQPGTKLLHDLGEEAAGPGGVSWSSFVVGALRELSVGLCKGHFMAYRASLGVLATSSGSAFRPGLPSPTDGHVE